MDRFAQFPSVLESRGIFNSLVGYGNRLIPVRKNRAQRRIGLFPTSGGVMVAIPDAESAKIAGALTTVSDIEVNSSSVGLVLKDAAGTPHYWRVTVDTLGALTTTDLGTSRPTVTPSTPSVPM